MSNFSKREITSAAFDPEQYLKIKGKLNPLYQPLMASDCVATTPDGEVVYTYAYYLPTKAYRLWWKSLYPNGYVSEADGDNPKIIAVENALEGKASEMRYTLIFHRGFDGSVPIKASGFYRLRHGDDYDTALDLAGGNAFARAMRMQCIGLELDWEGLAMTSEKFIAKTNENGEVISEDSMPEMLPYGGNFIIGNQEFSNNGEFLKELAKVPVKKVPLAEELIKESSVVRKTKSAKKKVDEDLKLKLDKVIPPIPEESQLKIDQDDIPQKNLLDISEEIFEETSDPQEEEILKAIKNGEIPFVANTLENNPSLDHSVLPLDEELHTEISEITKEEAENVIFSLLPNASVPKNMAEAVGKPLKELDPEILSIFSRPVFSKGASKKFPHHVIDAIGVLNS